MKALTYALLGKIETHFFISSALIFFHFLHFLTFFWTAGYHHYNKISH